MRLPAGEIGEPYRDGWVRSQAASNSSRRLAIGQAPSELLEIAVCVTFDFGSCTLRNETAASNPCRLKTNKKKIHRAIADFGLIRRWRHPRPSMADQARRHFVQSFTSRLRGNARSWLICTCNRGELERCQSRKPSRTARSGPVTGSSIRVTSGAVQLTRHARRSPLRWQTGSPTGN